MASRDFQGVVRTPYLLPVAHHGVISIAANSSVSGDTFEHATGSKSGTGEYTLTLDDTYPAIKNAQVSWEGTVARIPRIKSTSATSKTVVVELLDPSTGNPADPGAAGAIHITVNCKNSGA